MVTVGIPFRNSAATLEHAVRSVINQTCTEWRAILLNDGSTDTSVDIARSFTDPRISVCDDGQSLGLPHRLNQLIQLADTPYFARMDADDIMHPNRLERQIDFLRQRPSASVVASTAWVIDDHNRIISQFARYTGRPTACDTLFSSPYIHPTVTARTRWFKANQYDLRFVRAEDHELWVRTFASSDIRVIHEPLLFYREAGEPDWQKHRLSHRTDRHIMRLYGPRLVGRMRTAKLLSASLLADTCHAVCLLLLGQSAVRSLGRTRRRRPELTNDERVHAERMLCQAIA